LRFGNETIKSNDPQTQEKIVKFNTLVADCVIFHTALDMTDAIRDLSAEGHQTDRDLSAEGHQTDPEYLAIASPYIREKIRRFGDYDIRSFSTPPPNFDPCLAQSDPRANAQPNHAI
jgi:hypothetical protein